MRHTQHPEIVKENLRKYFAKTENDADSPSRTRIEELYVLVVLPACEDWDAAKAFIKENRRFDEAKRNDLEDTLERLKSKSLEIKIQQESKDRDKNSKRKKKEAVDQKKTSSTQETAPSHVLLGPDQPLDQYNHVNSLMNTRPEDVFSQISRVCSFLISSARRPEVLRRIIEVILTLILVTMVMGHPDSRARLRDILADGWRRVKGTIAMGTRIRYI
ncbi:hypothetical protein V1511DRAFT_498599 [Dipodascopsis uninucleata]